jgi:hypothetical protein
MKPENFDLAIKTTLSQYGFGAQVQLLSARDEYLPRPPYGLSAVTVIVAPMAQHTPTHVETWYYGGFIHKEIGPVPVGVRPIDSTRLISARDAVRKLPPGFPLTEASCSLSWVIYPGVNEPAYHFSHHRTTVRIGGYTGQVLEVEPLRSSWREARALSA